MQDKLLNTVYEQTKQLIYELQQVANLGPEHILVIGASSSEVIGKKIGTAGSEDIAKMIVKALLEARADFGFHVAFQCCEHLNRALVCEESTRKAFFLDPVTVVPVPKAGGAVAAEAFRSLSKPVMVEFIKADAGIDIGDTLIGMHLKHVAVPVRTSVSAVGNAHVTSAMTRPKLIGGGRAVYIVDPTV